MCLVNNQIKSKFLHRTDREITEWKWDENSAAMSLLHTVMWEQLRNKRHVKESVEKMGKEISETHPICLPAEKEQCTLKLLWNTTRSSLARFPGAVLLVRSC